MMNFIFEAFSAHLFCAKNRIHVQKVRARGFSAWRIFLQFLTTLFAWAMFSLAQAQSEVNVLANDSAVLTPTSTSKTETNSAEKNNVKANSVETGNLETPLPPASLLANFDQLITQGIAARQKNQWDVAEQHFEKAYQAATQNQARAQAAHAAFLLGVLYQEAADKTADLSSFVSAQTAREWYEKALALEHGAAANNLGTLFYEGKWAKKDFVLAAQFYRQSAQLGNAQAAFNVAQMIGREETSAHHINELVQSLEKSAAQDFAPAQVQLARLLYTGNVGLNIEQNQKRAASLFEQAAQKNDPLALYFLATQIQKAQGIQRDLSRAAQLFERAAAQKFAPALFELGKILNLGLGVPMDKNRARVLFEQAAHSGHEPSQKKLREWEE